jgi:hypothetical protein
MSVGPQPPFDYDTLTPEEAGIAIGMFNLDDPDTCEDLEILRRHPAAISPCKAALADPATPIDQQFAAATIWTASGDIPDPLVPLLAASDVRVRVVAAAGAGLRGWLPALSLLVDCLTDESDLPCSEPPESVWEFAVTILVRLTGKGELGPPDDADAIGRTQAQLAWRAWLTSTSLVYDPGAAEWNQTQGSVSRQ